MNNFSAPARFPGTATKSERSLTLIVNVWFCFNRKTNIFDSMIYMMENYADNLEDLVATRTSQLKEAKRETDELLYKILPR